MSTGGALLWLAYAVAGVVAMGSVRLELALSERLALAAVIGVIGSTAASFDIGLVAGVGLVAILAGPLILAGLAVLSVRLRGGPDVLAPWRESWRATGARLRRGDRSPVAVLVVALVALGAFTWLFSRALYARADGSIVSGYPTVWADWSLHSTLASSFVHGGNLPPTDPIFSGSTLRYPFLPDFHAGLLQVAGDSIGASLAAPGVVLCTAIAVLAVSLAVRLGVSVAVGACAVLLCVGGGSLGFTGVWWDACHAAGQVDADCAPLTALVHPGTVAAVAGKLPAVAANPPRTYDNLENPTGSDLGNVQWYTPLLAWWLPQRTFVYGFAVTLSVLLLVVAGRRAPPGTRSPFLAAGLLIGLLPLIHVHSLFVLLIVLPLLALVWRRREWWWMAGAAALLAVPRLLQVAAGGRGVPDTCAAGVAGGTGTGTAFPFLEPGWLSASSSHPFDPALCAAPGRYDLGPMGVLRAIPAVVGTLVDPHFWGFWLFNNGAVFVVGVVVGVVGVARLLPGVRSRPAVAAAGRRLTRLVPPDLLVFCLPLLGVFVVSNIVVFQTWDWDNTKLLAYWYLGGALLTATVLARLLRGGPLRALLATALLASLVASAGLTLTRYARDPSIPYTWESADDRTLATTVDSRTAPGSVFLTAGNPTDPVLTLAGRAALSGYAGWLYSYGTNLGTRPADIATMLAGCGATPVGCAVPGLLQQYRVDYVEICMNPAQSDCAGQPWYASRYPLVAASSSLSIYDVRRP